MVRVLLKSTVPLEAVKVPPDTVQLPEAVIVAFGVVNVPPERV